MPLEFRTRQVPYLSRPYKEGWGEGEEVEEAGGGAGDGLVVAALTIVVVAVVVVVEVAEAEIGRRWCRLVVVLPTIYSPPVLLLAQTTKPATPSDYLSFTQGMSGVFVASMLV